MNCDCLEKVPETVLKYLDGKAVAGSLNPLDEVFAMDGGKLISVTRSEYQYELTKPRGRKKKDTISIMHSYCPHCGKRTKYGEQTYVQSL